MFNIKEDTGLYTSKSYENWSEFVNLIQIKVREGASENSVCLEVDTVLYRLDNRTIWISREVNGFEFFGNIFRINSEKYVNNPDKDAIERKLSAINKIEKGLCLLPIECSLDQESLLNYRNLKMMTPNERMASLVFLKDSLWARMLNMRCNYYYISQSFPYFLSKFYNIEVSWKDLNKDNRIKIIKELPSTTFGITSCDKMEALIKYLVHANFTRWNIDAIYTMFIANPNEAHDNNASYRHIIEV